MMIPIVVIVAVTGSLGWFDSFQNLTISTLVKRSPNGNTAVSCLAFDGKLQFSIKWTDSAISSYFLKRWSRQELIDAHSPIVDAIRESPWFERTPEKIKLRIPIILATLTASLATACPFMLHRRMKRKESEHPEID